MTPIYQPNNATLIVVGDLDEQATRKLVDQYFGPIPRGPVQPRNTAVEPPQTRASHGRVADRGPDPHQRRRLPHPARGRSRSAGAGGAGGHSLRRASRRVCPSAWFVTTTWRSRRAASPSRWRIPGCSSSTRPIYPTRTAQPCRRRWPRRSPACATSRSSRRSSTRPRTSWRLRSCSAWRPSTAWPPAWARRSTSRATGTASSRGRPATWRSPPPTCSGWRASIWSTATSRRVTLVPPGAPRRRGAARRGAAAERAGSKTGVSK